ncbi:hypothetical protein FHS89_002713 [Rubricella aquisinus]|uniref:Alpha 1,4-glycosyltransferase conserved region n=1 Tax=Rubricella aquisinus TaxID=2028108 RepID=A0A840WRK8_9RHOB|nr:hypothetical protein [Rubricella aquisinus]MBB5516673.1 hypothetical protein [Rubricella aquisinus]
MALSTIGMLWMDGPFSFLEQLCAQSFLDQGHKVVLYTYGIVPNAPEGLEIRDATEILPRDRIFTHKASGSPALHSDLFRYRLMVERPGMIWADTDAYCLKPFIPVEGHYYSWGVEGQVFGGVLALPDRSEALAQLLDFTRDEYPVPPWFRPKQRKQLAQAAATGNPVHVSEMPWGVWGPQALSHFLHVTGEDRFAMPVKVLYPYPYNQRQMLVRKRFFYDDFVTEESTSIHFYGRFVRKRLGLIGGVPTPGTLLDKLARKHGIDPAAAPAPIATEEGPSE